MRISNFKLSLLTGYYRVNYDNDTWTHIGHALKNDTHSQIHVLNRAQVSFIKILMTKQNYQFYFMHRLLMMFLIWPVLI